MHQIDRAPPAPKCVSQIHKAKDRDRANGVPTHLHLSMYDKKPFDRKVHAKYLTHEKIENLAGLEVEFVYEWELGSMLIFDRTHLHCSSSKIEEAKISLTTFTKK